MEYLLDEQYVINNLQLLGESTVQIFYTDYEEGHLGGII